MASGMSWATKTSSGAVYNSVSERACGRSCVMAGKNGIKVLYLLRDRNKVSVKGGSSALEE